jgi:hypothetical protein
MKFELLEQITTSDSLEHLEKKQLPDNLTLFFLWRGINDPKYYGKGFIKELQSMSMSNFFDKFKLIDKDKQSEFVENLLSGPLILIRVFWIIWRNGVLSSWNSSSIILH